MRKLFTSLVIVAFAATGCSSGAEEQTAASTSAPPRSTTTTAPPQIPTTTEPPLVADVAPITGTEPRALTTPTGIVVPVLGHDAEGYTVRTPCGDVARVAGGTPRPGAHVVLDAGHGGDEPGAIGPSGLTEKEVNQSVVDHATRMLTDAGLEVARTRTRDYRVTLATRAEIATSLQPLAFVSVHHNAEPDAQWPRPGTETYYQIGSDDSKRLSALIFEEVVAALSRFEGVTWVADTDAGAKYRVNSRGGDYYGILRRPVGVPSVLAELAFVTNPEEEALLRTEEARKAEGVAVARGILRYLRGDQPGDVFTEPYPRESPAGSGGGATGCVDPPLA